MVLYLETKSGNRYVVHDNGAIERTDMYMEPSESWKLMGIQGGKIFVNLHEITKEWLEKNDVKKYTVCDWDHGMLRQWGDTLLRIWVYERVDETNYYKYSRKHLHNKVYRPAIYHHGET